jgi:hypothetical protein
VGVVVVLAAVAVVVTVRARPPARPWGADSRSPAVGTYVKPGTVGYLGSLDALTKYSPGGPAPDGCGWVNEGLECNDTDLELDHVHVTAGIYWRGTGNLRISNSVVEGGGGDGWYVVNAAATKPKTTGTLTVTDSTLRWPAGRPYPPKQDISPLWAYDGTRPMYVARTEFSGMPQGLDPPPGSVIENSWIHDLIQNSPDPADPVHLDGIFAMSGGNIVVRGNYIDVPVRPDVTAAIFFQDLGGNTNTGVKVLGNYISGGGYWSLRNQSVQGLDVQNNTFGGTSAAAICEKSGTWGTWSGNVDESGATVPMPTQTG